MLISRETDYAIRVLTELSDNKQHTVRAMSTNQFVPQQFCYKIIKKLQNAGYVGVARGAAGGCYLQKDLKEITLYDLLGAIGEEKYVNACMEPGYVCTRKKANNGHCSVHNGLTELQNKVDGWLKDIRLSDLLGEEPVAAAE